ncbi:hypothetical protein [Mycobacterium sp. HM-7]
MPASVDLGRAVQVTHNPVERLDPTLPRLPKMDLSKLFDDWIKGIKDLTGVDLSVLADILGGLQGGLDGMRRFIESLIGQGLDMLHLPSPEQAWQQIMATFLNPLSWLNNIPIGAITAATPNLLADFISPAALVGETKWVYDPDVEPAGAVGSVRTTLDGTIHELISERIQLDIGRKVNAEVKIKYSGITSSNGSPIRLSWIGWNGDAEVAGGDFAVHQPSGAALDWTTLSGFVTRQASDPWDRVSVVLKTMSGAPAGTVWFGAPRATKPDKLPKNLVDGLEDALAAAGQSIRDAICNALGVGGTGHSDADVIHALMNIPKAAVEGVEDLAEQVGDGFKAWWNHWFKRTDGDGSVAQIQQVVESVHDAVLNGYNVHPITADQTNWPVPVHTECLMIATGGGQKGDNGFNNGSAIGKIGGLDGSWLVTPVDLTGITALDTTIGTQGNRSVVRVANTANPHTGAIVFQSPTHGSTGGIATPLGYTLTTSTPGRGGNGGGMGTGRDLPTSGGSSAIAAGGLPGSNNGVWGTNGQDGQSVSAGAATKCGGSGGGGGGAAVQTLNVGGNGGAGGYPGGAGGAGGNCNGTPNQAGVGGPGAIGCVWILTR